ncbi:MAG: hypothetical protein LQ338_006541, partial [Usnochroma carphineum]
MDTRGLPSDGHTSIPPKAMQPIQPTDSATPSLVAPSSDRIQPSQQARLLQLRNAGFRGQTIPIRRISPILGSSGVLSPEPSHRVVSNENTPHNLEKRQLFGEDLPLSPVSILQELHNSAQRRRRSRPSIGAIFQDGTATPAADGDSGQSWYTETSNKNSKTTPTVSRNSSIPMNKLRDVSFNGKTPPISSSPLPKQSRSGNGNRVHRRTTSAEAAKYIEHLESQLVAVNTKVDSLMSPTSHKARAAKLRALTSEARSLRLQVSDWEQKFDERVKDKRDELAEVEMSLAARLQALEDEVEAKDNRVKGLEWELENLRTRVKDAEGLEAVNTDLERRIDVLTNLLVQSPTKLDLCSANTSPSKPEPYKRMTRPRSMMPRVPPSPGSMRLSLSIGSDAQFRRSRQSVASTSSASPSPDTTSGPSFKRGQLQTSEGKKESKDSSDQSSGNSSLFQSPPSSSSRPTSLYSNGSFGAYSWGLPLPPEAEPNGKANHKQRRMRRFPSGAASLKPLILPSTAGTPSLPASAPVQDTIPGTTQRDFSDASLDPTIGFLSKYELHSPVTTPTQPGRRRSASSAQTEALSALEGRSSSSEEKDGHSMLSPCSSSDELLETVQEESFDGKSPRPERPRSLGEELEEAGLLFRNSFDEGLNPYADQDKDQSLVIAADQPESDASQSQTLVQQQQSPKSTEPRMKPKTQVAPTQCASCTPKLVATVAVATPQGHGLLSRLKCLVSRTKQGPSALARRLIYNAWAVGLARTNERLTRRPQLNKPLPAAWTGVTFRQASLGRQKSKANAIATTIGETTRLHELQPLHQLRHYIIHHPHLIMRNPKTLRCLDINFIWFHARIAKNLGRGGPY